MKPGRLPFPGPDFRGQKLAGNFEPLGGEAPPRLKELVAACLHRDPVRRPQGMRAVQEALAAVFERAETAGG